VLGYSQNTEKMSPSAAECDFTTYFQSAKPFAVYTETQLEQRLEIDAFIIDAARVNHTIASICAFIKVGFPWKAHHATRLQLIPLKPRLGRPGGVFFFIKSPRGAVINFELRAS
jgi:hypothetical protein